MTRLQINFVLIFSHMLTIASLVDQKIRLPINNQIEKETAMIGNLKEKAKEKALEKLESEITPAVEEKIELFQNLKPSDVNDDEKYKALIVTPLWEVAKMQSGGAINMAQKFVDVETRFNDGMFNVRNELVQVEGETVYLDPDFNDKVVPVLIESFKE